MDQAAELSTLIDQVYAAVGDEERWITAMRSMARWTHSDFTQLLLWNSATRQTEYILADGRDMSEVMKYIAYADYHDPRIPYCAERAGHVFADHEIVDVEEFNKTEIVSLMRHNNVRWALGGFFGGSMARYGSIGFCREERRDKYSREEAEKLEILLPHLSRAFSLHFRFSALTKVASSQQAAIDQFHCGIVILDRPGKILIVNRAAEALLQGEIFTVREGRIAARNSADRNKLARVIKAAADRLVLTADPARTGNNAIFGEGSENPVYATALPIQNQEHLIPWLPAARVILYLARHTKDDERLADALKDGYGLTPSEVRLAVKLCFGRSLDEAASELGVSRETVKTHLKAIFGKTGCHKQSILVQHLLSLKLP